MTRHPYPLGAAIAEAALRDIPAAQLAEWLNAAPRSSKWQRLVREGLGMEMADEIATRIGIDPGHIWPDYSEEREVMFVLRAAALTESRRLRLALRVGLRHRSARIEVAA